MMVCDLMSRLGLIESNLHRSGLVLIFCIFENKIKRRRRSDNSFLKWYYFVSPNCFASLKQLDQLSLFRPSQKVSSIKSQGKQSYFELRRQWQNRQSLDFGHTHNHVQQDQGLLPLLPSSKYGFYLTLFYSLSQTNTCFHLVVPVFPAKSPWYQHQRFTRI